MDMQDKEFDKIFNSKFEDFEVEPSPMVWDNIADELDGKKGKRSIMPYLSIAATVLVMLTAGALFLQKQNKPTAQHNNKGNLAANHVKPVAPVTTKPIEKHVEPVVEQPVNRVAATHIYQPENVSPVNKIAVPVVAKSEQTLKQIEPVKTESPQLIAAVTPTAVNPIKVTLPDVQLSPRSTDVVAQTPVTRPAVMASNEKAEQAPVKKRGIHNLGGLINALVAKVDKREDKLIEFSDSDDDDTESNVTGVNLGVIKIKKQ
jgi:hypothetical protein